MAVFNASAFIKEVWQLEAMEMLKHSKGLRRLFALRTGLVGAKEVTIPLLGTLTAKTKEAGVPVSFEAGANSSIEVALSDKVYTAIEVDRFDEMQTRADLRQPNIEAMIEALELQKDTRILSLLAAAVMPDGQTVTSDTIELADGDEEAGTKVDKVFRRAKAILAANGVSPFGRSMVVHPFVIDAWLGTAKVSSRDFVDGETPMVTGAIGMRHGAPVVEHSQAGIAWGGEGDDFTTATAWFCQRDAIGVGEWESLDINADYVVGKIGTEMVGHTGWGLKVGRPEAAIKCLIKFEGNPYGLPAPE